MSERSTFILTNDTFIKVISLNPEIGNQTEQSLKNGSVLPFESNEFLFSYLISQNNNLPTGSLITPGTQVLVSGKEFPLDYFNKYLNSSYQDIINDLMKDFILMNKYTQGNIRTALIVSQRVNGSYLDFLKRFNKTPEYNKLVLDSLIHIIFLFHTLQEKYQAVHGDPKVQNFTWLQLPETIDISYDFDGKTIIRKGVKHLFYLTDLEFVWSPIVKSDDKFVYNFHHNYFWYGHLDNPIFVPKISEQEFYQLNFNLYGGYTAAANESMDISQTSSGILELFNGIFPRMFTIDILTLIKMLLTYWMGASFDGNILRKLNIYFTKFVALSLMEENVHQRNKQNYLELSPSSFANLLNL